MIIKPQSIETLKEIFVKIFLSRTDRVTKVSDGSVVNAIAYAAAKLAQKSSKDIALVSSRYYPDSSHGEYLDDIARMHGISDRLAAVGSSTYVRVYGDPGTLYNQGTHVFTGSNGIQWGMTNASDTIGADGFMYIPVRSTTVGANTEVEALTITQVAPIPVGHENVVNEYKATGGRDLENDDQFRERIKNAINLLARPTREALKQVMLKFNPDVLRVFNYGDNGLGKIKLGIATVSGRDLTTPELEDLLENITPWLSLAELNPDGLNNVGVELVNINWEPVDISFRVQLDPAFDPDKVRKDIQIRMNKYLDYRIWVPGSKIEWDDLLQIAKSTEGVVYVPDQYFYPQNDLSTNIGRLPRIRGFLMLNQSGGLIVPSNNQLDPVYYPTVADFSYISTVLANL